MVQGNKSGFVSIKEGSDRLGRRDQVGMHGGPQDASIIRTKGFFDLKAVIITP
jgi:hypothetical protein